MLFPATFDKPIPNDNEPARNNGGQAIKMMSNKNCQLFSYFSLSVRHTWKTNKNKKADIFYLRLLYEKWKTRKQLAIVTLNNTFDKRPNVKCYFAIKHCLRRCLYLKKKTFDKKNSSSASRAPSSPPPPTPYHTHTRLPLPRQQLPSASYTAYFRRCIVQTLLTSIAGVRGDCIFSSLWTKIFTRPRVLRKTFTASAWLLPLIFCPLTWKKENNTFNNNEFITNPKVHEWPSNDTHWRMLYYCSAASSMVRFSSHFSQVDVSVGMPGHSKTLLEWQRSHVAT